MLIYGRTSKVFMFGSDHDPMSAILEMPKERIGERQGSFEAGFRNREIY
jgi:hypothetical protein